MSATAHEALGKTVFHCLKGKLVVRMIDFCFVAAAHDLKQEVGGMGVVGQVANLVNREEAGADVGAQPPLEGARGLLTGEIEDRDRRR